MNIYLYQLLLIVLIIAVIAVSSYITFQVSKDASDTMGWIWEHCKSFMIIYLFLLASIIVVSCIMFTQHSLVVAADPLTQPGIFLYATAVLLTSSFFIDVNITQDNHPLLFYTTVFFLGMGLITGVTNTYKKYRLHKLHIKDPIRY